jgi:hypothetical protein
MRCVHVIAIRLLAAAVLWSALAAISGCGASSSYADLKADVRFTGTQFVIVNNDATAWTEVRMRVNDDYRLDVDAIAPKTTYSGRDAVREV